MVSAVSPGSFQDQKEKHWTYELSKLLGLKFRVYEYYIRYQVVYELLQYYRTLFLFAFVYFSSVTL